jgi:hypothetical protein
VLDDPLCKLLSGGVGDVLLEQPPQQVALLAYREPNREKQLIASGCVIHG